MPELIADPVNLGAGHERHSLFRISSLFRKRRRKCWNARRQNHATRFDIVCCEVKIPIAYRCHNGIIAM